MLHDIGHTPFSHTLEEVVHEKLGMDHMDFSRDRIFGKYPVYSDRDAEIMDAIGPISEMLESEGISADYVGSSIRPPT